MPGILLLLAAAGGAWGGLPEELSGEGDWEGARVERLRERMRGDGGAATSADGAILAGTGDARGAEEAWAEALSGGDAAAGLSLGYSRWKRGDAAGAAEAFEAAYLGAGEAETFWEAGAALWGALSEKKELRKGREAAWEQLGTVRGAWPVAVRRKAAARMDRRGEGWLSRAGKWPGRAVTGLYRKQISPAIGSRCSLWPSCSGYFLEATKRHGLLGVPMGADRLVREPGVVAAEETWMELPDGRWRIADPVAAHDGWMGKERP